MPVSYVQVPEGHEIPYIGEVEVGIKLDAK